MSDAIQSETAKPARKHPLLRRIAWTVAAGLAVLAVTYGVLAYRYYRHPVKITRNYAAELNAPILMVPAEQRAWTHYRRALMVLEPREEGENADNLTDNDWPATAAYLKRNAKAIDMLREAARIRPLGVPVHDGEHPEDVPVLTRHSDIDADDVNRPSENPFLLATGFSEISAFLDIARVFQDDARLAIAERDGQRAAANFISGVELGEQTEEMPLLLGQLISLTLCGMPIEMLTASLARSPQAFSDADLGALSARLDAATSRGRVRLRLAGERATNQDIVQRYFTHGDDGEGYFTQIAEPTFDDNEDAGPNTWFSITAPVRAAFSPHTRRHTEEALDRWWRNLERFEAVPLWQRTDKHGTARFIDEPHPLYVVYSAWMPGFGTLGDSMFDVLNQAEITTQRRDAALIAIALTRFRRDHGKWPERLAELTPRFLREVPLDRFDGQQLRYRLIDDQPLLYAVGFDREDNGGKLPDELLGSTKPPYDVPGADWVLWPPVTDEGMSVLKAPEPDDDAEPIGDD